MPIISTAADSAPQLRHGLAVADASLSAVPRDEGVSRQAAFAEADRIAAELSHRIAWARASYRHGVEDGVEIGRGQALAEEAAQRREAAGLVRSAIRDAAAGRDRWTLRGEWRTRGTFGQPHCDDFAGRGDAA